MAAHPELSRQYGTAELAKEGSFPMAAKLALAMLNLELAESLSGQEGAARGAQETAQAEDQEAERMAPVQAGLHMHHGAEKLAQLAGAALAKTAGIGSLLGSAAKAAITSPVGRKTMAVSGLAAGLYGGSKLLGAATNYRQGPQAPKLYGSGAQGPMRTGITEFGY